MATARPVMRGEQYRCGQVNHDPDFPTQMEGNERIEGDSYAAHHPCPAPKTNASGLVRHEGSGHAGHQPHERVVPVRERSNCAHEQNDRDKPYCEVNARSWC